MARPTLRTRLLKGRAFARAAGLITLADDSGLEVDALGGQPGLHSARYVNRPGSDRRRPPPAIAGAIKRTPQTLERPLPLLGGGGHAGWRSASWHEGVCEGEIIPEERGQNGFGYDPIFLIPELGKSMAELSMDEKNQLSHRARAVKAALPLLEKYLTDFS